MIPSDFIDELLSRIDIVDLIGAYVPLKKAGANYHACCPFHKEKTPSFTVSPTKQFYHCFGCGAHGTAIGFLMEHAHLDFVEAVEQLAHRIGLSVPHQAGRETPQERAEKKQKRLSLEETLKQCALFFQQQLVQSPKAQQYLQQRGLNQAIIQRYGLGYVSNNFHALQAIFDDYPNAALLETGMLTENEGKIYDRFRDRIMFPIIDNTGRVIGFGGRVLDDSKPKYLNSPETPLFSKGHHLYGLYEARSAIKEAGCVLVVEGYMDVVALAQHNIAYAVAALGTATTSEHIRTLFRQTDAIYFCFDGDDAGRKAAWRALDNALPYLQDNKSIHFLFLPKEHDPDSFVRTYGAEKFEEMLKKDSIPLSDYWLKELLSQVNTQTNEGRAQLLHLAKPYLQKIGTEAQALRYLMMEQLAKHTKIETQELHYLIGQALPPKRKSYRTIQLPQQSFRQPESQSLVDKLTQWLLINPQWASYVKFPDYLVLPVSYVDLMQIAELIKKRETTPTSAQLWENLRFEYSDLWGRLNQKQMGLNADLSGVPEEDEKAFAEGIQRLLQALFKQQINELAEKSKKQPLSAEDRNILNFLLSQKT